MLYLASSRLVAPDEPTYFERWLAHIRSAENPLVQRVQVLVRPHPLPPVFAAWVAREISRHNDVVLFPDDLQEALTSPDYHSDYADSMRHCAVAVGLNSSSMVEVAIFGKAVLTWEDGPFGVRQQQTLHYHHLLEAGGGLLHVATNAADHLEQLDRYLREAATGAPNERSAAFVRAFVRPRGLDRLVAPLMAEEIADLLDAPTQVAAPGPAARAVGERLKGLSFLLGLPLRDKPARSVCVRSTASAIFAWLQLTEALDTRRQQAVLDLDRLGTVGRKRLQKGATRSSKRANRLTRLSRKRLQKWSTQTNRRITQTDKRIAHINKRARKKLPKLARRYRKRAARVLRHTRLAPGKVASRRIIHRSRRALKRILSRNPRATRLARRVLRGLGYSKKTQA
ncbi:MAG TPA: hypothetical protein VNJ54_02165 [Plantibacter sp.]|uniref:hypothetical protein n=1 Tax=Plantibacter sp. TaxID=1871045 RepID=UPI002C897A3C|nr:hypothetical protein [Plantibacter sp.]